MGLAWLCWNGTRIGNHYQADEADGDESDCALVYAGAWIDQDGCEGGAPAEESLLGEVGFVFSGGDELGEES